MKGMRDVQFVLGCEACGEEYDLRVAIDIVALDEIGVGNVQYAVNGTANEDDVKAFAAHVRSHGDEARR